MKSDVVFAAFLIEVRNDPNILGLVLLGSRGKGLYKEYSDYDFQIIVKDEVIETYKEKMEEMDKLDSFDSSAYTLKEFEKYAKWGSEFAWSRYSYANVEALIDKTDGKIQEIINNKEKIPEKYVKQFIEGTLDAYINSVYRSMKGLRDKNDLAYRLEAANSIGYLLQVIFALHERRIKPYYKYLEYDLEKYPLTKIPWSSKEFIKMIKAILDTGNYKIQQSIMIGIERACRSEGYGHVFDWWEGDEKWTMTYKH